MVHYHLHYSFTHQRETVLFYLIITLSSICINEVTAQCQCYLDQYCYHNTDVASNEVPSCYPGNFYYKNKPYKNKSFKFKWPNLRTCQVNNKAFTA